MKHFITLTGIFSPMFVYPAKASHKGVHSRLQICMTVYQSEAGLARAEITAKLQSQGVHLVNGCFQIHDRDLSTLQY